MILKLKSSFFLACLIHQALAADPRWNDGNQRKHVFKRDSPIACTGALPINSNTLTEACSKLFSPTAGGKETWVVTHEGPLWTRTQGTCSATVLFKHAMVLKVQLESMLLRYIQNDILAIASYCTSIRRLAGEREYEPDSPGSTSTASYHLWVMGYPARPDYQFEVPIPGQEPPAQAPALPPSGPLGRPASQPQLPAGGPPPARPGRVQPIPPLQREPAIPPQPVSPVQPMPDSPGRPQPASPGRPQPDSPGRPQPASPGRPIPGSPRPARSGSQIQLRPISEIQPQPDSPVRPQPDSPTQVDPLQAPVQQPAFESDEQLLSQMRSNRGMRHVPSAMELQAIESYHDLQRIVREEVGDVRNQVGTVGIQIEELINRVPEAPALPPNEAHWDDENVGECVKRLWYAYVTHGRRCDQCVRENPGCFGALTCLGLIGLAAGVGGFIHGWLPHQG